MAGPSERHYRAFEFRIIVCYSVTETLGLVDTVYSVNLLESFYPPWSDNCAASMRSVLSLSTMNLDGFDVSFLCQLIDGIGSPCAAQANSIGSFTITITFLGF